MFVIVSKPDCPWCDKAKSLLRSREESFSEFSVAEHPILRDFLYANGMKTVPQIWYKGDLVGMYTDLEDWFIWQDSFARPIEEDEEE